MARGEPDGMLPVDKPEGPTSHDIVARARRALGIRRVGHTGTLDPFASGLLLICVGRATRLAEYLSDLPKTYLGVARLGVRTDTDDGTGRVLSDTEAWRGLASERVEAAFRALVGEQDQVPPAFSAKKVGGERLYRRARRGEAVRPEPVRVRVHRLRVLELDLPRVTFEVACSSGTYVRALARDAGDALGTGAHLERLRRTAVGGFEVGSALYAEELEDPDARARAWIQPLEAVAHLPRVEVDEGGLAALTQGRAVATAAAQARGGGDGGVVAVAHRGRLVAIGEAAGSDVRPRKVFAGG